MNIFKLFLVFVKIGAILLGGGYVILPILQYEFVEKRKLISQDDLINYYALSQSLPGIIAANITMFIGYKLHGLIGGIAAMIGILFVPFFSIVLLASFIGTFVNNSYIQGAIWGIGIAVIALIALTISEMWHNSEINIFFYTIFFAALYTLLYSDLTPVQVILIYSTLGIVVKYVLRRSE